MNNFNGIWIPANVWLADDLKFIEKLFLVQINHLDNQEGCFASNTYFSNFFGLSKNRCSAIIRKLASKKYISIKLIYGKKNIEKRIVKILTKGIELFKQAVLKTEQAVLKTEQAVLKTEQAVLKTEQAVLKTEGEDTSEDTSIKILNEEYVNTHTHEKKEVEIFELPEKSLVENSCAKKEKSCAKKEKEIEYYEHGEMPPHDLGYQFSKKRPVKQKGSSWSQLDINLSSYKDKLPKNWSVEFTEKVIDFWRYCEEKKGVNWGTIRTIKSQVESIENYLMKFSEQQIINSISDCIRNGNISFNPQWTINRINKEKDEEQRVNRSYKKNYVKFGSIGEAFARIKNTGHF